MKKFTLICFAVAMLCYTAFAATATVTSEQGMGAVMKPSVASVDQTGITPEYAAEKASHNRQHALDATSLCNALVCVQTDEDGDFNIGTSATHPFPNRSLLYFYPSDPWSTDIRIYVDGLVYNLTAESGSACDGLAAFVGEVNTGAQIIDSYTIGALLVDVIHTPVLFSATAGAILTRTVVTNNDQQCHNIGVLYEYDTTVDSDDAAELYLGATHLLDETCFDAPYGVNYWDAIPLSGNIVGRGTFTGGDAVTPDHLAFGRWPVFYGECWGHVCPASTPYGDSAVLYQWDPLTTCPGETRNVATYYGVGDLQIQPGDLQISVAQPPLSCEPFPLGVQPDPFNLLVNITNTGGSTCTNVTVTVTGGAGPGGTAPITSANPQVIPVLTAGDNAAVNFVADLNGNPIGGCIYYDVTVTSDDCPTNAVLDYCVLVPPCDTYLAVELLGFDAISGDHRVTLRWTTASESNNDHFEITRGGLLIHSVPSAGNTSSGHSYEWLDNEVENGRTYSYSLIAVDVNGQREELGTVEASPNANAVVVTEYALHQNFPNPFNPSTTITFDLVESGNVTLQVFNLMGQEVATLVNGNLSSGRHTIDFNAASLPSGLYLYKLEANGFSAEKKMLLMK
jgi:hypothetical protein